MKKTTKALLAVILCFGLAACGSSGSASADTKDDSEKTEETEATEKEEEVKEEVKETASWEVGEAKAVTWTDSIGSNWVQVICPVINNGTKNLYMSAGTMDLEDADGHLYDSLSMVSVYPDVLQPGETGFYYEETILDGDVPSELSVLPHVKVEEATVDCIRYETSEINIADEKYGGVKITGRVENTTAEDADLVYVVAFLYDAENNMIGSEFTILTDTLTAGDKIGFSMSSYSSRDITASAVDHYEVYAYPNQFQF